jgi:MarR family transcriptional regulator, organic hydroperoxide resistance regulator
MARRPTAKPDATGSQLARAAYELHTAVERELREVLDELGLTIALADALWQLDPALGALSRRELAERLRCHPSNVTFLIDRLERRRLVVRAPAAGDRRVRALELTPAGAKTRERMIVTLARSRLFGELESGERRELVRLLSRCIRPT